MNLKELLVGLVNRFNRNPLEERKFKLSYFNNDNESTSSFETSEKSLIVKQNIIKTIPKRNFRYKSSRF